VSRARADTRFSALVLSSSRRMWNVLTCVRGRESDFLRASRDIWAGRKQKLEEIYTDTGQKIEFVGPHSFTRVL
jgi:hypothetical protein